MFCVGLITELKLKSARYGGGYTLGGGWGTVNDFLDNPANWKHWGRSSGRVIRVSMGERDVSTLVGPGPGIPQLVPGTPTRTAVPLPPPIDRRDEPSGQETISTNTGGPAVPLSDQEWFERMYPGQQWVPPITTAPPQTGVINSDAGDNNVSVIGDIYDVVDAGLGGWLPGGVPVGSVSPTGGVIPAANTAYASFVDTGTTTMTTPPVNTPPGCGGAAPVYKKVCGEYRWVYPKRRRRKSLVTKGDIKGLAALKGVLGNGKAMETWIATHS